MRVLFTSTAGVGHLYPLLPLARAARAAGDDVLVAIPETGVPAVAGHGFAAAATPAHDDSPEELAFWRALPEQPEPNTYVISDLFGNLRVRAALPRLRQIAAEFRPDLIVSEAAEFAGPLVAELRGVPHCTVGIISIRLPGVTTAPLIDRLDALRGELGLPPAGVEPWAYRTRYATGIPDVLQVDVADLPAGTLPYRFEDAEVPTDSAPDAPRSRRPRVYATLGTAAPTGGFADGTFHDLIAGLAECDADVLFTVGSFDQSVLGAIPENVEIAGYVPQQIAMRCDAVISHAGSGTATATLSRGLPTVAVPLFADQPHNAERIAAAGAGVVVPPTEVRDRLAGAVHLVLSDPSYSAAAGAVAAQIASKPSASEVYAELRSARVPAAPARRGRPTP